ncbi:MAG: hypothetical protein CSA35_02265 [Dethiosulfovibrio peptidovorans]|nr:MAG: hypothetical protein CSA35_02265 [Dethiosulfovibrio peptidovorans]
MTDRMNSIRPVGSISPTKLRRVQRREKDGRSSNQNWQETLENELNNRQDDQEHGPKSDDNTQKDELSEEKKNDAPPPSRPILVPPNLDIKA